MHTTDQVSGRMDVQYCGIKGLSMYRMPAAALKGKHKHTS